MTIEPKPFTITVFGIIQNKRGGTQWQALPATGAFLTSIQFVPAAEDWVSVLQEDWPLLGLDAEEGSFRSVLVVKHRIAPYFGDDVAVLCRFQDETGQDIQGSQWQRIPLN